MTEFFQSRKILRIAVSGFFFIYGFCFASWASRIPNIQQSLGLSDTQLGLVLLALPVGSFISLPISGLLVAKKGSKKVVIIAALAYIVLLLMIGSVHEIYQLVIVLFFLD